MCTIVARLPRAMPLLLLGLAACGDAPTAPGRRAPPRGSATAADVAAAIPNTVKYRDAGHHPATGRSGGADVTVRALLGVDGVTAIEVYVGQLGGTGPGELKKVQLKLFDLDGKHLATVNEAADGTALVLPVVGLRRNTPLQVQANVQGAAGPRTGVVTVRDVVKLRPDLAVAEVVAPPTAVPGLPTTIGAIVRELNGDVGARATCLLDVDGVPVDSATGIWVDAGGTVTCHFTHTFTTTGEHALRARVAGIDPGDWSAADDFASGTILVQPRELPFSDFNASARQSLETHLTERWWRFVQDDGAAGEEQLERESSQGTYQYGQLYAFVREPTAFPSEPATDIRLFQATGGSPVHEATIAVLAAEDSSIGTPYSSWCARRRTGSPVVTNLQLCTSREVRPTQTVWYTEVSYAWSAGDVTYESLETYRRWCGPYSYGCLPNSYGWNTTTREITGTVATFGTDFTIELALTLGDTRHTAATTFPLVPNNGALNVPQTCSSRREFRWPPFGWGTYMQCSYETHEYRRLEGWGHG